MTVNGHDWRPLEHKQHIRQKHDQPSKSPTRFSPSMQTDAISSVHEPITHLIVIRHGETDWNQARRLQGHLDIPLNANGLQQAHQTGLYLQNWPFPIPLPCAIISSDLSRAAQTADIINKYLKIDHQTTTYLRERHYGQLEGLTPLEVQTQFPQHHQAWAERRIDHRLCEPHQKHDPHCGESLVFLYAKVQIALNTLSQRHPHQTLVLVTHGGILDMIYRMARPLPLSHPRDFPIGNASIQWLKFQQTSRRLLIEQWGITNHLIKTIDEIKENTTS